jgi:maltooligosyltrehalose synthase
LSNAQTRRAALFRNSSYEPLQVNGARSLHVIAFARRSSADGVIVAVGTKRWDCIYCHDVITSCVFLCLPSHKTAGWLTGDSGRFFGALYGDESLRKRLPDFAGEVWGDTTLSLPANLQNTRFREVISGEEVIVRGT